MLIDFSMVILHADSSTPTHTFTLDPGYDPDNDHDAVPVPAGGAVEGNPDYHCSRRRRLPSVGDRQLGAQALRAVAGRHRRQQLHRHARVGLGSDQGLYRRFPWLRLHQRRRRRIVHHHRPHRRARSGQGRRHQTRAALHDAQRLHPRQRQLRLPGHARHQRERRLVDHRPGLTA